MLITCIYSTQSNNLSIVTSPKQTGAVYHSYLAIVNDKP